MRTAIDIALMVVVLFFSVIVHEVAHGYIALLNGDPTAKNYGRLSFNPLVHIDPIGTILVPAILLLSHAGILFGWAKPVPVNPLNYRNYRQGEITVSVAGPLSNLLLAVIFAVVLRFAGDNPGLVRLCYYGCIINIFLALFNLIPIPPLDGSHVLLHLLPRPLDRYYAQLEPVGFVIILILLYTGVLNFIIMPIFRFLAAMLLG
ncbi:MAG: site-2 protease family protein [Deltaproteobacteria bacterium]|nr:site-2 protease family protein [Deltaproteobacteria bacterium]MBW1952501.1 site-2 protease family protein [Deltaproteobacteria bacterium]MBW1987552.1 site-2 protease family protein [Deltaproteobacteria bacterium]MBW2135314.1 site-2 protease family protein [Deltaproteobacteria bacterium]